MDRRIALPIFLMLLLGYAHAMCQVVDGAGLSHRLIVNAVYEANAYSPFSSMTVTPTDAVSLERNTLILVDPRTGQAVEVGTSDTAADPAESIFSNAAFQGPYAFSLLLSDTLRVAREGSPYLKEPLLRERFSGRYEIREANEAVLTVLSSAFYPVLAPVKSLVSKNPPIPNHIETSDWMANIVCASSGCRKELYSLLTKYLNIGASSEMLFEVFGARVLFKAGDVLTGKRASNVLSKVKAKITGEEARQLEEVTGELRRRSNTIMNTQLDLAERKLTSLPSEKQTFIKEAIAKPEMTSQVIRKLSTEERAILYRYLKISGEDMKALARLRNVVNELEMLRRNNLTVRDLTTVRKVLEKLRKGEEVTEAEKEIVIRFYRAIGWNRENRVTQPILERALSKPLGEQLNQLQTRLTELKSSIKRLEKISNILPTEEGKVPPELKSLAESVGNIARKLDSGQTLGASDLLDLSRAIELSDQLSSKYLQNAAIVGRELPVLQSQFDVVSDAVTMQLTGESTILASKQGFLSKYLVAPLTFYFLRAGPTMIAKPSFSPEGSMNSAYKMFFVKDAFTLPPEWTMISLQPLQDEGAILDILINHGSDPGDVFKTFLTIMPVGWLDYLLKNTLGISLPGNFLVTEEDERTYHMKSAIVTFSVSEDCTNCSASRGAFGVSFLSTSPALLSVTENSKPEEGSTVITFFRKTNVIANGEKILDVTEEDRSCLKTCTLLRGPGRILKDHPELAMFSASVLAGYIIPLLTTSIPAQILVTPTLCMVLTHGCYDCVDTVFGYYLHTRAPSVSPEYNSPEDQITRAITDSLQVLGIEANVEGLIEGIEKSRIEKKQVMLYLYLPTAKGILKGRIVSEWARPESTLPTGERKSPLVLVGDKNITLAGSTVTDGENAVDVPSASLSIPDSTVPGIIIPSQLIETAPSTDIILRARSSGDYEVDPSIEECVGGTAFGLLKQIVTDKGTLFLDENGITAQAETWSGSLVEVVVYSDFRVVGRGINITIEDNEVRSEELTVELGRLQSIVFEDASIIQKDGKLLVWDRTVASTPKESSQQVTLSPSPDGRLNLTLTPSPDATPSEVEEIEKINDQMKGIDVIEGSRKSVAIVEDPETGEKYLRIYDKEKNIVINEKIKEIVRDENDPTAVKIRTVDENGEEHEHTVKISLTSDGTPILKIDGESGGVVQNLQTDKGFLYYDPETGQWKLINGVLAPLAEAFKNGIKLSFQGGVGTAVPSKGIVINNLTPRQEGGLSLPFMGPELVLLLLGALVVYFIV